MDWSVTSGTLTRCMDLPNGINMSSSFFGLCPSALITEIILALTEKKGLGQSATHCGKLKGLLCFQSFIISFKNLLGISNCCQAAFETPQSPQGNEGFIIQTRFRRLMREEGPLPTKSKIQLFQILKKKRNKILLKKLLAPQVSSSGKGVHPWFPCDNNDWTLYASGNRFVCA